MKANSFRLGRMKTMDIETKNDNKVYIKIPLENGGFWQKEYYQNDLIEKVIQDFKAENHVDIPQDYFMDWNFKNKSLKMTDKIKTLLNQEIPTVCINQVLKKKPIKINNDEIIPDLIGKPFNDPFEVFLFAKDDKSLKIQTYDSITVNNLSLNDYSPSSAFCNGNNHLFISGGQKKNGDIIDNFWEIDLKNQNIAEPVKIPPKKNHSMIFIPNNYVFIVGGNDKKTFYFNTESAEVCEWANLNILRTEPALERISNNLYCFDNINKGNNDIFTLEKTNLNSKKPQWILMTPKIDAPEGKQFTQKFFGVSKDSENNIIFLGGNMDDQNVNDEIFNYKYNTVSNNIEVSNVPYRKYNFKEKTFLPYKKNIDYILPDFNKQHPEVVFFVKNKNKIEAIDYEPKINNAQLKSLKVSGLDTKYDFNMPSVTVPEQIVDYNFEQNNNKTNGNDPSFQDNNFNDLIENKETKINNLEEVPNDKKEVKIEPTKEDLKVSLEMNEPKKEDENINLRNKVNNKSQKQIIQNSQINPIKENDYQTPKNYNNNQSQIDIVIPRFHAGVNEPISTLNVIQKSDILLEASQHNKSLNQSTINANEISISNNNANIQRGNKPYDTSLSGMITGKGGNINAKNEANLKNIDIKKDIDLKGTIQGIKPNFFIGGIIHGVKNKEPKEVNNKNATIGIKVPKVDNKTEINLNGPNVNGNLKGPSTNVDLKGPNINGNLKGPSANVDLKGPKINDVNKEIDLKGPNVNVDLKGPNVNDNKEINLKGPSVNIDMNEPNINNNSQVILKGPKINNSANVNNNNQNINLNAPKIDINLNNPNNQVSGKNISEKINNPNHTLPKMPDFNISGNIPGKKISTPNVDINLKSQPNNNDTNIKVNNIPKTNFPDYNLNGNIPGIKTNKPKNNNIKPAQDVNINGTIPGTKLNQNNIPNVNDANLKGQRKIISNPKNNEICLTGVIYGTKQNTEKKETPNVNYDLSGNIPGIKSKEQTVGIPSIVNFDINGNIPGVSVKKSNENKIKEETNVSDNNEINPELKIHSPKKVQMNLEINNNKNEKENKNKNENDINMPKIETPNANKNIVLNEIIDPNYNKDEIIKESNNLNNTIVNITEKNISDLNISGVILGTKANGKLKNSKNNNNFDESIKKSETFVPLNRKINPDNISGVKNNNVNTSGNDFCLTGIIAPSKTNQKQSQNDPLNNYNQNRPILSSKNFHGNINFSPNGDIQDIKGPRKPNYSDINNNKNINDKSVPNNETEEKNPNDVNIVIKKMQILPQENINLNISNNQNGNKLNSSQNVIERSIIEYYSPQNEKNNENIPNQSVNNNMNVNPSLNNENNIKNNNKNNNNIIASIPKINIQNNNNKEHKLTDLRFKTIKEDENNNDIPGAEHIYSGK
jgi:hypothetical protein